MFCLILFSEKSSHEFQRAQGCAYVQKSMWGHHSSVFFFGCQQYSTVTFVCRWSPDLPEQYQPGRRHLQRGSGGHTQQLWGGAAHHLTAKRWSKISTLWPFLCYSNVKCYMLSTITGNMLVFSLKTRYLLAFFIGLFWGGGCDLVCYVDQTK